MPIPTYRPCFAFNYLKICIAWYGEPLEAGRRQERTGMYLQRARHVMLCESYIMLVKYIDAANVASRNIIGLTVI